jgi:hypothetical protein
MPYHDFSRSGSGGAASRKSAPAQNRVPIIGAAVAVLVLAVAALAWSMLGSHSNLPSAPSGPAVVLQRDPGSPNDLPPVRTAAPQGTAAMSSMYNANNGEPVRK